MAQRRWWCWKQSCVWHLPVSFGACAQPALERGALSVVPRGAAVGSLAEDGRHHLKPVLRARRQRRGSCPVHRKAFIKRFSMSWVSKTPAPKVQSLALSVCETVFFCASLCIPVPAFPCRSHQHPQLALEMDRSISNRDYLLCWKHQSVSQGVCLDHLVWYWPLWKQLCWALVKFQNFGVIL